MSGAMIVNGARGANGDTDESGVVGVWRVLLTWLSSSGLADASGIFLTRSLKKSNRLSE